MLNNLLFEEDYDLSQIKRKIFLIIKDGYELTHQRVDFVTFSGRFIYHIDVLN